MKDNGIVVNVSLNTQPLKDVVSLLMGMNADERIPEQVRKEYGDRILAIVNKKRRNRKRKHASQCE